MKKLEQTHKELHSTIKRIVEMKNAGDVDGAEREYKTNEADLREL